MSSAEKVRGPLHSVGGLVYEAEVARLLESDPSVQWVKSPEFGVVDLALYLGDDTLDSGLTDRFFQLKKKYHGSKDKKFLCIEIKRISWQLHERTTKPWTMTIKMRRAQADMCDAIIIGSPEDPEWVALMPYACLVDMAKRGATGKVHRTNIASCPSFCLRSDFPPELCPFVMPKSYLLKALQSLRDWAKDPSKQWTNPWTNIVYTDLPRPRLQSFDALLSANATVTQSLNEVQEIWQAFKSVKSPFRVELPMTAWNFDLLLVHEPSGITITVEMKSRQCKIQEAGDKVTMWHSQADPRKRRLVFGYHASWDYLFTTFSKTTNSKDRTHAIMMRKEAICPQWWNLVPAKEGDWISATQSQAIINRHTVPLNNPVSMVGKIISIITQTAVGQYKGTPPILSQLSIPLPVAGTRAATLAIAQLDTTEGGDVEDGDQTIARGVSEYQSASDMYADPRSSIDGLSIDALMDQCREKKRGVVFLQGYIIDWPYIGCVDYEWSEEDCKEYDRIREHPLKISHLVDKTPVLLLDYFNIEWVTGSAPLSMERGEMARFVRSPDFLAILDAYPIAQRKSPHTRFLVPSNLLPFKKDQRSYTMEKLALLNEVSVDSYAVGHKDLHKTIFSMFDGEDIVKIGLGQRKIEPAKYFTTIGAWRWVTYWSWRNKTDARTANSSAALAKHKGVYARQQAQ